ncbi:MAG TPA: putative DNA modification/repair radical SAM protein [Anaeromyxobacteraceae bacterium]|nr:putative DNA modification/repair radical SAM protein [Anaeromyxobacteraceae bacterium]
MDRLSKLQVLAGAAKYDASCASSGSNRPAQKGGVGNGASCGVCHSFTPDGRCVSLLKILLTNACIYDCQYCANRRSADVPRARFTASEVAELTIDFYRRNYIEGLFLSSGIVRSPDYTMEQMVEVTRLLRDEHRFGGYIHLKAIPGASDDLLARAGLLADRLSVNIELPTDGDLVSLAPDKDARRIETGMRSIRARVDDATSERRKSRFAPRFAPAGQTTQMVIGASPTPDGVILSRAAELYGRHALRRVYYSAYSPTPSAGPNLPRSAAPLVREHRLYQADWLMRFYGFDVGEILEAPDANLSLDVDPKLAWALRNRALFPVDVNAAAKELLLRVPGLGVRGVDRIIEARRFRKLGLPELRRLRIPVSRAAPFLVCAGANGAVRQLDRADLVARFRPPPRQLGLFESASANAAASALTGEL